MNTLKGVARKTPFYRALRSIYRRIRGIKRHPLQDFKSRKNFNLVHLGTEYGGWTFVDNGDLYGCTIVSAGLGEDASFDVEFASKYRAKVVIVDPTPRAVRHFNEIISNLGNKREFDYSDSGCQPIQSYDLSNIGSDQLSLVEKALWNESKTLKFFAPTNPQHVSHSIVNYQNSYRDDTSSIEVQASTLESVLFELNIKADDVAFLKLDIEGAEIEVINDCLTKGIRPKQILVEYDELNVPSEVGFKRVTDMHDFLLRNGYFLIHTDGQADFLYVRC
jgi:FkbM family methyltransferase